jgi:hypothetical protein
MSANVMLRDHFKGLLVRNGCLAILATLLCVSPVRADPVQTATSGLVRQLLEGCLKHPSKDGIAELAKAVGATHYPEAKIRHRLAGHHEMTFVDDTRHPDEARRATTSTTAFDGWDLPGSGAGSLEYDEENMQTSRVKAATGQLISSLQLTHAYGCDFSVPIANARAIFELYEMLQPAKYGMLIDAERRWISVWTFDPLHYDIELHFQFNSPLAGIGADSSGQPINRLILSDGGPRFEGNVRPGISTATLTRAALLSAIDRAADMQFGNNVLAPIE